MTWGDLCGNDPGTANGQKFDPPKFVGDFFDGGAIEFGFTVRPNTYKGPAGYPNDSGWT
ncbi:MAG: hypothetical protein ACYTFA_10315 [Planctomycetota bacterium]|jgi:hypothetical protein